MSTHDQAPRPKTDHIETLSHGERWFLDGFSVIHPPGGVLTQVVDMTRAQDVITRLKTAGVAATYTHLLVRAAALALSRCPDAHKLVCGYKRMTPGQVDIGLSVAGQTNYAPVLVIADAASRPLRNLVDYLKAEVPKTREKEVRDLEGMRKNGWWIPVGFLRRAILRLLRRMFWFQRKLVGTFQLTVLRDVDTVIPILFYSGAALGVGAVRDRVIAVDGQPQVRKTAILSMAFDHRTLDGKRTADLLLQVCQILEGDELLYEADEMPHIAKTAAETPLLVAKPSTTPSAYAGG